MTKVLTTLWLCAFLHAPVLRAQARSARHPYTIEDDLARENIVQVAPSPRGHWVAVVIERSQTAHEWYLHDAHHVRERADVWLISDDGSKRRNLTHGLADAAGYWNVSWSPDGRFLAILSTHQPHATEHNVWMCVWDMAHDRIRELSRRGVDLWAAFAEVGDDVQPYAWVDNKTLAVSLLPPGQVSSKFVAHSMAQATAMREWPIAERGERPTHSILDVGPGAPPSATDSAQITVIDAESGDVVRSGGSFPVIGFEDHLIAISPDGQYAAASMAIAPYAPSPARITPVTAWGRHAVGLMPLRAGQRVRWSSIDVNPRGTLGGYAISEFPLLPRWSTDSRRVAFIGYTDSSVAAGIAAYVQSVDDTVAHRVSPATLRVKDLRWWGDALSVRASPAGLGPATSRLERRVDWWRISLSGDQPPQNLTASFAVPPEQIVQVGDSVAFFVADSGLWSADMRSGDTRHVVDSRLTQVQSILGPPDVTNGGADRALLVEATPTSATSGVAVSGTPLVRVDVEQSGAVRSSLLRRPSADATLLGYRADGLTVFQASHWAFGQLLWFDSPARLHPDTVVYLNRESEVIRGARRIAIRYPGVDGDSLDGVVILPVDYVAGKRYPLIVRVYAGNGPDVPVDTAPRSLDLFAAHGYAVLWPDMPLVDPDKASDPAIDLTKSVFGAIDKVVALGIADPDHVGVYGESYGGYSVLSLITYSNRFRAAVSLCGFGDMLSMALTFNASFRYREDPPSDVGHAWTWVESTQGRMGGPPWSNLWRYWRNSPINYLDRVNTPLLLLSGDVDGGVPMEQSEEVFSGLYRLGKRVRFVRYWGEGHGWTSPANQRDGVKQVYQWFDHFLKADSISPSTARSRRE